MAINNNILANDVDIEQDNLIAAGNRIADLKKIGICLHGWINTKTNICYECKKEWDSTDEMNEEIDELRFTYL